MPRRQPLPALWLMTDERMGDSLFAAIARLPRGSGIVFRHYGLAETERRALFERVRRAARRRGHLILLAGPPPTARAWRADGSHGRGRGHRTAPVHDLQEIRAAERAGAERLFLSPLHRTASHKGQRPLGALKFAALARATRLPVVALGGMDRRRAAAAARLGAEGWAAIDAWTAPVRRQKRKAVPT